MSYPSIPSNSQSASYIPIDGQKTAQDQLASQLVDLFSGWVEDKGGSLFDEDSPLGKLIDSSPPSLKTMDNYITYYQEMEPPPEFIKYTESYIEYLPKATNPFRLADAPIYGQIMKDEKSFTRYLWMHFVNSFFKKNLSKKTIKGVNKKGSPISNMAAMQQKLIREFMMGDITTVPLFNLSTMRRALMRPCRVICREPSITFTNLDEERDSFTWFSGLYEIVGFVHTINGSRAESRFTIIKGAYSSLLTDRKSKNLAEKAFWNESNIFR